MSSSITGRENQVLPSIEGLRLISSVAIVLAHFLPYALRYEPFDGRLSIFVDLFFVISGLVIASAYASRMASLAEYGLFIQRRLARLYPLHLATMLVYIAIAAAAAAGVLRVVNPERYSSETLIPYLTLTQAWGLHGAIAWNGVTWSISAELFAYLLFPAVLWSVRGRPWLGLTAVAILTVLCATASVMIAGRSFLLLATQIAFLRALPSFAFGVWLTTHADWLGDRVAPGRTVWLVLTGCLGLAGSLALAVSPYVMLAFVWMIVAGAFLADKAGRWTFIGWSPVSRRGELTYSIYLIHPVVATTVLAFIGPRLFGPSGAGPWCSIALGLVLVFILSACSYRFFERPLRMLLGKPLFRVRDARRGAVN